jgi:hypothetical protein
VQYEKFLFYRSYPAGCSGYACSSPLINNLYAGNTRNNPINDYQLTPERVKVLIVPLLVSPRTANITMRLEYAGAEALNDALEYTAISDTVVDKLLGVPGIMGMVDNVTNFYPTVGRTEFREDINAFVRTRDEPVHDGMRLFSFADVWQTRAEVRQLISALRSKETAIVSHSLRELKPYRPISKTWEDVERLN